MSGKVSRRRVQRYKNQFSLFKGTWQSWLHILPSQFILNSLEEETLEGKRISLKEAQRTTKDVKGGEEIEQTSITGPSSLPIFLFVPLCSCSGQENGWKGKTLKKKG